MSLQKTAFDNWRSLRLTHQGSVVRPVAPYDSECWAARQSMSPRGNEDEAITLDQWPGYSHIRNQDFRDRYGAGKKLTLPY